MHAPAHAEDGPGVAQRAAGQPGGEPPQDAQVALIGVGGNAALEEVDAQVLFPLALGVPQHGGLDRLDFIRAHRVELILGNELVAWRRKTALLPHQTEG